MSNEDYEVGEFQTPKNQISRIPIPENDLMEIVLDCESKIQNERRENVVCFDECGNVICHLVGDRTNVSIPVSVWERSKIITHNHPDGATPSGWL